MTTEKNNEVSDVTYKIDDGSKKEKRSVFISTPAYEGKLHVQYAMSLLDTNDILKMTGNEVVVRIPVGSSLLVADRNRILQLFWETKSDYLLCVDSDLGWDPTVVLRFLEIFEKSDKEFIAGVYPSRDNSGFTFRPELEDDGRISMDKETGLLKMQYVPAGFMMMKRSVIEKLQKKYPELYYTPKDPRSKNDTGYCFFNTEVWEGEFWGEDYVFCRRVRDAGIDIWVDPTIEFNHAGVVGSLMQVLTNDPNKAQK